MIISPDTVTITINGNDDQHGVIGFDPVTQFPLYMNEDAADGSVSMVLVREGGTYGNVSIRCPSVAFETDQYCIAYAPLRSASRTL